MKMKNNVFNKEIPIIIFTLILALAGPFFLIPLENWSGMDILLEEVFKLILVLILAYYIIDKVVFLFLSFLVGLSFALTENILYLSNFIFSGSVDLFWERFFLTSFLHIGTTIIIAGIIFEKKCLFPVALLINIILHFIFNNYL